jgi:hypothetical protein
VSGDALEVLLHRALDACRQHQTTDGAGVRDTVDRPAEPQGELGPTSGTQLTVVVEEQHPLSLGPRQHAVSGRGKPRTWIVVVGDPGGGAQTGQSGLVSAVLGHDDVEGACEVADKTLRCLGAPRRADGDDELTRL